MATGVDQVKVTLEPNDHPYRNGAWTPVFEELNTDDLEIIGTIPADIDGLYIRNTENPVHDSIGRYHPFDGDGMIHALRIRDGKASYRNRFVRTEGFEAEQQEGGPLWVGIMGKPDDSRRPGWGAHGSVKDSSSTDVVVHAGAILSTFYQCGEGYRLDPETLETLGTADWVPEDGISAHPKVDEATGELLFFNYSTKPPYLHYGVVGADNQLKHCIPVELPGARLPHDMAFTENFAIFNDCPLYWKPELIERNLYIPAYHPDEPTRFGIIPRRGQPEDIKWFDASPTYVLHWTNAYEDGDEIVLDGYFQNEPVPPPLTDFPAGYESMGASIDLHSFKPELHRWRFNMKTGETSEETLFNDYPVEFGMTNQQYAGRPYRYVYSVTGEPGWFLFNGLTKHDLETGEAEHISFGEQRFGSEAPFIPRPSATSEDDGYLISFITDMKQNRSECVILDAQNISAGPVCTIILPHRISSGTHATWASAEQLG
ncbi:carotenoid oxygenase family protein [Sphingorhabdus sp. SMR4y]|uniref:carotenoid oxygenase family protein n=1 Tax=Sphingorhabdus sp. SMR4y TaxID=2584094 RepID=UPI000B5C4A0A|nr:carotenoid oxygenase family protein [Sphingorhabdus sp. SMR4y]ASK88953.1 carotenoid cleavage oxygenase [Sphingorhabdus sp. SMR4y]